MSETSIYGSHLPELTNTMNTILTEITAVRQELTEKTGSDNKTSVCTVYDAFWAPYTPSHVQVLNYTEEGMVSQTHGHPRPCKREGPRAVRSTLRMGGVAKRRFEK